MTSDQLRELADTVNSIYAETYTQREAIDSVVAYLRAQAEVQPVAWIHDGFMSMDYERVQHDEMRNRSCGFKAKPIIPLYTHPAPAAPQAEPKEENNVWKQIIPDDAPQPQPGPTPEQEAALQRMADNARELGLDYEPMPQPERQPLTDEQIDEIGEPFGYFTYGDAQGDKRRAFVRAIESSHGIGYGKAIEGGPSELRSCTCHPDDNPPAPCAQQYALNECRAAQGEPTEAHEPRWVCLEGMNRDELAAYDYGCAQANAAVRAVLDGEDTGEGTVNEPWASLRRRLLALVKHEPTEAQIEAQHPDDAAVDRFAAAMKAKLAEKRAEGRGGWDDPEQCSTTYLAMLLRGHVEKGDPLDVGNFAMMLWNRGGATNEAIDAGIPDIRLTEAQIAAAAKELCQCHAEGCGVDPDDTWKVYCGQFREEATRVLRAALAAKDSDGRP